MTRLSAGDRAAAWFVLGLAGYSVLRAVVVPGPYHPVLNAGVGIALLAGASLRGMTPVEVGTTRNRAVPGLRLGLGAGLGIATALGLLAALPATTRFFDDNRADVTLGGLLVEILVVIPLGTVLLEEIAFRGILLGLLGRSRDVRSAVLLSALAFGFWHIPPTLSSINGNAATSGSSVVAAVGLVAGAGAAMMSAGAFLAYLRTRSGSLIAPIAVHTVTNVSAFTAAWFVVRH